MDTNVIDFTASSTAASSFAVPVTNRDAAAVANELMMAKRDEARANKARVALEEELISILGQREEGSKTHSVADFKVTITSKMNRKMDWKLWETIADKIPADLRPVKLVPTLDETGVKYLQNNEPSIYRIIAKAMTVTAAKTSVTIARIEN